jgi:hypothetical protein
MQLKYNDFNLDDVMMMTFTLSLIINVEFIQSTCYIKINFKAPISQIKILTFTLIVISRSFIISLTLTFQTMTLTLTLLVSARQYMNMQHSNAMN